MNNNVWRSLLEDITDLLMNNVYLKSKCPKTECLIIISTIYNKRILNSIQ